MDYSINNAKIWSNGSRELYNEVESNGINHHGHSHSKNGINNHSLSSYNGNGHLEIDSSIQNTRILFLENENKLLKANLKEKEAMIDTYKKRLELLDRDNNSLRKKQHLAVKINSEMISEDIKTE